MIEGHELAPNLWVLRNSDTARNTAVILSDDGAIIIDGPATDPADTNALARFLADMNTTEVAHLSIANLTTTPLINIPGWEALTLSPNSYHAFYHTKERILLSGDLLRANNIPNLAHGSQPYLDALDQLEALDIRLLLPLYGPEARGKREIKARIEQDRSYTLSLQRHVTTSRAARVPLDRVLQVAFQVYEDYPHLQAHLQNIRLVWNE